MLVPLTQFICDTCHQVIEKPEDGWVEWLDTDTKDKGNVYCNNGFRIIHRSSASPKKGNMYGCSKYGGNACLCDTDLAMFLNPNYGMAQILSLIDVGAYHQKDFKGPLVKDVREYIEFVRRLTIPHYDEAQQYWADALSDGYFGDENELGIYSVANLRRLVEHYSEE